MAYIELSLPPGLFRAGTERQSKNRYWDASLVRWYANRLGPIGGWREFSTSAADVYELAWTDGDSMEWVSGDAVYWTNSGDIEQDANGVYHVSGVPRAVLTWRDNSNQAWAAIGTHTGLYVMTVAGVLHQITPDTTVNLETGADWLLEDGTDWLLESTAFATGRADSDYGGGYGSGAYGVGLYGAPGESQTVLLEATQWTLDTFGQYLIACLGDSGSIYNWQLDTSADAVAISGAPTAEAIVVTPENFLMAIGADGNPRNVQWADQGSLTTWTASATNQAGDLDLVTNGRGRCGKRVRGGTLIFTDVDVHLATYIGGTLVYGFQRVASGCGVISKQCVAAIDSSAYWMGKDGFWMYNGYVQPMPCDIQDSVFTDKTTDPYRLNRSQSAKVSAIHISAFGEIWWVYPSADSTECDRAVVYNYREGHWNNHVWDRTCGTNRDAFAYPIMLDSSGYVYEHEIGIDHDGAEIFAESGPVELGSGDNLMHARWLVPDEETEGECETIFKTRDYPASTEAEYGPYISGKPTSVRFGARSTRVRYQQKAEEWLLENGAEWLAEDSTTMLTEGTSDAVWRIGAPRLEVVPGGRR